MGLPWWLLPWHLTYGRRHAMWGTPPPWSYFVRLLPPDHPLYESRSWVESMRLTPLLSLPIVLLHGMPQPCHRTFQRICLECLLPGLIVGAIGYVAAKCELRRLRAALLRFFDFEKPTQRLARKLAMAQRAAPHMRAQLQIETRSLLRARGWRPLAALPKMPSYKAKAEAARGLQPKRDRLIARLTAHAKRARAAQIPEMRGVVPCLQVRRQSISSSLRFVSHLPAVALELGQLRIKFIDEPAVDAGGVFREFVCEMARSLSISPLLTATSDGALLPTPGQGDLERLSQSESEILELIVPLGDDGKLGCMLGTCASPNVENSPRRSSETRYSENFSILDSRRSSRFEEPSYRGGEKSGPTFSVLQVEEAYPAAQLLKPGDALLAVNGAYVEGGNSEQALSLIRQAAMESAPATYLVRGAGLEEVNGTYTRLQGVVRGGGAPVYAKGNFWLARYLVRFTNPSGKRQTYVWFLQNAEDMGDLYQVRKPFVASIPPCDGWSVASGANKRFRPLEPPPTLVAGSQCSIGLTICRGLKPYNPAWQEELYAVGRLMAIAIATDTPLDVPLSRCVYKLLLAEPITADDVARIDLDFARFRVAPLLPSGGVAAMEEVLGSELYFTGVPLQGSREEQELVPGGSSLRVTESNKHLYISLLIEHYLVGHCREELAILTAGFHDLIPQHVLCDEPGTTNPLRALDLELIVAGLPFICVNDWRKHTKWSFSTDLEDIEEGDRIRNQMEEWLFEVLEHASPDSRATILSFVCGSAVGMFVAKDMPWPDIALLKASAVVSRPEFHVEIDLAGSANRLPTAHTCFNQLCMPRYNSRDELEERLMAAAQGEGDDLAARGCGVNRVTLGELLDSAGVGDFCLFREE